MDTIKTKIKNLLDSSLPPVKVKYVLITGGVIILLTAVVVSKNRTVILVRR